MGGGAVAGPGPAPGDGGRQRSQVLETAIGGWRRCGCARRDNAQGKVPGHSLGEGGGLDGVGPGGQGLGDAGVGVAGLNIIIVGHRRTVGVRPAQQVQEGVLGGGQIDVHLRLLAEGEGVEAGVAARPVGGGAVAGPGGVAGDGGRQRSQVLETAIGGWRRRSTGGIYHNPDGCRPEMGCLLWIRRGNNIAVGHGKVELGSVPSGDVVAIVPPGRPGIPTGRRHYVSQGGFRGRGEYYRVDPRR